MENTENIDSNRNTNKIANNTSTTETNIMNRNNNKQMNDKMNNESNDIIELDDHNRPKRPRNSYGKSRTERSRPSKSDDNSSDFIFNKNEKSKDIIYLKAGDRYSGTVKILRKAVPGPVIFTISDGYGSIDAATKTSNLEMDDVVDIAGTVNDRAGRLQLEIASIKKTDKDFSKIIEEKSAPARTDFSIKSERYETMLPAFLAIAKRIRRAIIENQPILIRHHNDSDGINSGLALEIACKELMTKLGINSEYNLYRSPSKAPFYEVSDVFRDIISAKRLTVGHGQKKPLIIVADNGSTPEDMFAFKALSALGYEAIVIDHHNPVILNDVSKITVTNITNNKSNLKKMYSNQKFSTGVCEYLSLHLNPYLFGLDSQTSAGMLCYEMGRFISEEFNAPAMPAVAAISDRCNIPETELYITNSKQTRDDLTRIGTAIDFMAYQLKFDSGKGLIEEVYTSKEIVDIINEKVKEGIATQLQSTLPYLRTQEINGIIFSHIDLEKYTVRFSYPNPGKVIGMIHDQVALGKENQAVFSIGYMSDMIIIRATKPVLPVQKIIETLRKELPEANVDGGGHEMAGTIKFVPAHLTTIIEKIKTMLKDIKHEEN